MQEGKEKEDDPIEQRPIDQQQVEPVPAVARRQDV
ncbi:hypothetical protein BN439_2634 [Erwinia amylovora Ea644]|nr:hypothetical protein BN439_2634 [Erwinia amylovora Ea644]